MNASRHSFQATVLRYLPATRSGEVVDDEGVLHDLPAGTLDRTVRHLRPGQRVRLETVGDAVTVVTLATLPSASPG